jgi:hypothetical protein
MEEIEDVGTGDAREEIFVTAGESDDLVREVASRPRAASSRS